jgi:hypothetical protein
MRKILEKIKGELLEILPAFLFFLFMFNILLVTKSLTLKEYGITVHASAFAFIGALIVSKAILVANKFPFLNLYPRRPLIWNVVLKTVVFSLFVFLFLFAEELFHQVHKGGGLAVAYKRLWTDVAWPIFWASDIWLNVLLFFYCAAAELTRVVGADKVKNIFFNHEK